MLLKLMASAFRCISLVGRRLREAISPSVIILIGVSLSHAARAIELNRGINIHHAMNWAKLETPGSIKYAYPPFQDARYQIADRELEDLRSRGFDWVRLTVDPGPFLELDGERLSKLDEFLVGQIHRILAVDMSVVIDLHPNSQNASYSPARYTSGVDDAFVLKFGQTLARLARIIALVPGDRVALELLNEPETPPGELSRVQSVLTLYYKYARDAAPTLPLVVPGAGYFGGARSLDHVPSEALRDANAIFTFHFYSPFTFTHQGEGKTVFRHLTRVPFPLTARILPELLEQNIRAIEASAMPEDEKKDVAERVARVIRQEYYATRAEDPISTAFDFVAAWAKRNEVPASRIVLGEFGANRPVEPITKAGGTPAERSAWLTAVRTAAESRGFAWGLWVYRGWTGMMLTKDLESESLDETALNAVFGASQP